MAPNQEEKQALLEKGLSAPSVEPTRGRFPVVKVVAALALLVAAAVGVSYSLTPKLTEEEKELQRLMAEDVGDDIERINHFGEAADSYGDLSLLVHRVGYSPVDLRARRLYGWDHIAEPFVENVIRVENTPDDGEEYTYSFKVEILEGPSMEDLSNQELANQGSSVEVTFPDACNRFRLHVVEYDSTGTMTREAFTETLVSKFVRREIRAVKDEDRDIYIKAVKTIYTLTQEEGEELYGQRFVSHSHLTAQHNDKMARYHVSVAFINVHPTIELRFEQALRAINKKIITPYWDYLVDAKLEGDWIQADAYRMDWFGSVQNGPEVNYEIQGAMAGVTNIYDPDGAMYPRAYHNAYGYLGVGYFKNTYVQRTNYFCNYESRIGFSNCKLLAACITKYADGGFSGISEFDHCLELNVHGMLHDMTAGMWDCNVDFGQAKKDLDWLNDGTLSFLALNSAFCTLALNADGVVSCESACSTEESCTCKPNSDTGIETIDDVDNLTDDELYDIASLCTANLVTHQFRGHVYLKFVGEDEGEDESTENYGRVVWRGVDPGQNNVLNRLFVKNALFPGVWGPFVTGASSVDPIFFSLHQVFDKAMHLLRTSGEYKDVLDFSWLPLYHDKRIGWYSQTAFNGEYWEPYLGGDHAQLLRKDGKLKYLTNKETWALLKPDTKALPYVYSDLNSFGECDFSDAEAVREYAGQVGDKEMVFGDMEELPSYFKPSRIKSRRGEMHASELLIP